MPLFDISEHLRGPIRKRLFHLMEPLVSRALALKPLSRAYQSAREHHARHPSSGTLFGWFDSVLSAVHQNYDVEAPPDFEVPREGPLLIVSNRPFGLLEPIIVGHFIARTRPDLRIVANDVITNVNELAPYLIKVTDKSADEAKRKNAAAMKEAIQHLRQGGALLVFPASEVAHYRPGRGIREAQWSDHVGALARRTGASVLPVYFPGHNSLLFQATGMLHRHLRTGMVMREFVSRKSSPATMRVGQAIATSKLRKFSTDADRTSFVRLQTLVLEKRHATDPVASEQTAYPPVAHSVARNLLQREVDILARKGCELTRQSGLVAYISTSSDMPHLLHEIGRLREITFRAVGEGTGLDIDLDKFDRYYLHLFIWDEKEQQIAGAYRIGRAKQILEEHGTRGLYTNTLFKFKRPFLAHLQDAVEMGRSFVCAEYQRNAVVLPMLWKAIVIWMGRNPQYRKLFGPVSISQDYDAVSKRLIVEFLEEHHSDQQLSPLVKPRKRFRSFAGGRLVREFVSTNLADVDDCSAMISSLETDGKGLPVLLKHYLRLNGTILSFNVDKQFSNVLDGLIMVDLLHTDPRLPTKLMGKAAWEAYLKYHEADVDLPARQSLFGK